MAFASVISLGSFPLTGTRLKATARSPTVIRSFGHPAIRSFGHPAVGLDSPFRPRPVRQKSACNRPPKSK